MGKGNEELGRVFTTVLLIDGVGQVTALAVLAGVPELGKISDAAAAKLVGAVSSLSPPSADAKTRQFPRIKKYSC